MNDIVKTAFMVLMLVILMIGLLGLIGFGSYIYCQKNPSYLLDDMCFNPDYRCGGECLMYDSNYTGIIKDKCLCDCGEFYVSYCSGFRVDKVK
jgi:hypothetical protein